MGKSRIPGIPDPEEYNWHLGSTIQIQRVPKILLQSREYIMKTHEIQLNEECLSVIFDVSCYFNRY
jgi:hypothetical protein